MGKNYLILIDALRYDYINEQDAPFLYGLKKQSITADVLETFAFQTRPAYFAGLEPEQSNICHLFRYDPINSPFRWLKYFRGLLSLGDRIYPSNPIVRSILRRLAAAIERSRGNIAAAEVMTTERIPLHLLENFALSETKHTDEVDVFSGVKTLFDELRERQMNWSWIGYPRHYGSTSNILKAYSEAPSSDLYYLHFSELDWIGHRSGPESNDRRRVLREIDAALETLLDSQLKSEGARAVIFGDHGMVPITYALDLWGEIERLPYQNGREYLAFYDSTQVRFWFFDAQAERDIREVLLKTEGGHVLSDNEKENLCIRFSDRSYGDCIFMIHEGGIIHPSYFVRSGSAPRGMHGYLPDVKDNMTQIMAVGDGIEPENLGVLHMTEMYQVMKRVLF